MLFCYNCAEYQSMLKEEKRKEKEQMYGRLKKVRQKKKKLRNCLRQLRRKKTNETNERTEAEKKKHKLLASGSSRSICLPVGIIIIVKEKEREKINLPNIYFSCERPHDSPLFFRETRHAHFYGCH